MEYTIYIMEKIRDLISKYAGMNEISEVELCIPKDTYVDVDELISNFKSLYNINVKVVSRNCPNLKVIAISVED